MLIPCKANGFRWTGCVEEQSKLQTLASAFNNSGCKSANGSAEKFFSCHDGHKCDRFPFLNDAVIESHSFTHRTPLLLHLLLFEETFDKLYVRVHYMDWVVQGLQNPSFSIKAWLILSFDWSIWWTDCWFLTIIPRGVDIIIVLTKSLTGKMVWM